MRNLVLRSICDQCGYMVNGRPTVRACYGNPVVCEFRLEGLYELYDELYLCILLKNIRDTNLALWPMSQTCYMLRDM